MILEGSATRIDPKLDFTPDDADHRHQVDKYPDLAINHKLYNVRVIVDAARSKQPKHMDAEVFTNVNESGTNKKTIGVQTNITFEVSDEKDDSKAKDSGENASVPVFKGKSVDKKNKPETKVYYDYSGSREGPVFPKIDDDSFRNLNWFHFQPPSTGYWTTAKPRTRTEGGFSGASRRRAKNYKNNFLPADNFIPYGIGLRPSPSPSPYPDYLRVKPCFCKFHDQPHSARIHPHLRPSAPPPSSYDRSEEVFFSRGSPDRFSGRSADSIGIDDKLDYPFHA